MNSAPGVRGRANSELTAACGRLGRVAARVFAPAAVVGGDSRQSTPMLKRRSSPVLRPRGRRGPARRRTHCRNGGRGRATGSDGCLVSASHNPYHDNGIKMFAPGGTKLADEEEARIQQGSVHCGIGRRTTAVHGAATSAVTSIICCRRARWSRSAWVAGRRRRRQRRRIARRRRRVRTRRGRGRRHHAA